VGVVGLAAEPLRPFADRIAVDSEHWPTPVRVTVSMVGAAVMIAAGLAMFRVRRWARGVDERMSPAGVAMSVLTGVLLVCLALLASGLTNPSALSGSSGG
jgi:hypothetical protein